MRPEYNYRSIGEPQPSPEPKPTYQTVLRRYQMLTDLFLRSGSEEIARKMHNQYDQLNVWLDLTGSFALGRQLATPGALEALKEQFQVPAEFLIRHKNGDWSEMSEEDQEANRQALINRSRVLSSYDMRDEGRILVITEADRSATTLLLPEDN